MEVKGVLFSLPCRWHQLSLGPHPGTQSVLIPKDNHTRHDRAAGGPSQRSQVPCLAGVCVCVWPVFACKLRFYETSWTTPKVQ